MSAPAPTPGPLSGDDCYGETRSGIYVASRASVPARGEMWRTLRAGGAPIISTWIDEDGEGQSHDLGELWERILREVTSAERLILYVEPDDFPLKGAFIEVGMALAAGVPVFVVSPGVALDARSLRPLGSWALHPLVTLCQTMGDALHGVKPAATPVAETAGEAVDDEWLLGLIGEAVIMAEDQEREDEGDVELRRISEGVLAALRPYLATPPVPAQDDDKLRVAVEAMQGALKWDKERGYRMPYRVRDPLYAAIDKAALKSTAAQEGGE